MIVEFQLDSLLLSLWCSSAYCTCITGRSRTLTIWNKSWTVAATWSAKN